MSLALETAIQDQNEVPVGAVIVWQGQLLARANNQRERSHDPTAHAEILALREASQQLQRWNLNDCTLYVTLEPCPMCLGAILLARISRLVYGCHNLKLGAAGSILGLHDFPGLSLRCNVTCGIMEKECAHLIQEFFHNRRITGEVAEPG